MAERTTTSGPAAGRVTEGEVADTPLAHPHVAERHAADRHLLDRHLADRRLGTVGEETVSPEISTAPADLVEDLEVIGAPRRTRSSSGAFPDARSRRRYWIILSALLVMALGFAMGLLAIGNPMPVGTRGFWLIAEMRATSLVVMAVVAFCQSVATITFMTVTNNRIITPSIMGFESLYTVIQTAAVYTLGAAGVVALQGTSQFLLQVLAMVGLSVLLYGWLLRGRYANIQVMLLVGIIIGGGMGAVSTFMQRLLSPSEFDVLTARLFGSVTAKEMPGLKPTSKPFTLSEPFTPTVEKPKPPSTNRLSWSTSKNV